MQLGTFSDPDFQKYFFFFWSPERVSACSSILFQVDVDVDVNDGHLKEYRLFRRQNQEVLIHHPHRWISELDLEQTNDSLWTPYHFHHLPLNIHTNVVVKKVGPNCSGTDNFWKSGEAKWSLAAARTNWRNLEL